MAETYKQMVGVTYTYTDKVDEVPQQVKDGAKQYGAWPEDESDFIAACWIDQMGARYKAYVVFTSKMALTVKAGGVSNTARWTDVSSIGRSSAYRDVVLGLPGGKMDLFHAMNMPKMALLDKMEEMARKAQSSAPAVQSPGVPADDIPTQIKKLKELLDMGAISEQEFQAKKADLLAKM